MKSYKSSIHRLAHLFKKGRDLWKSRALERQKKLKSLCVTVRDLSKSRDNWKLRAKTAEKKLHQIEETKSSKQSKYNSNSVAKIGEFIPADECSTLVPARHHNPVFVIQLAIEQFMISLNSFRGSQKTFESFGKFFSLPIPSFSNIRSWMLRVGLYQLQQNHEKADDWIFILDLIIELGQGKCLVILGIRKSRLEELLSQPEFSGLKHQDVVVLSLEILHSTKGIVIEQCLNNLSLKVGVPIQIISDHGSDLKKGIELYVQNHSQTIYTHDVTHHVALQFKAELEKDEQYQSFLKHCSEVRNNVQQTEMHFLRPPSQKNQSRYLNVEKLVEWGNFINIYRNNGDFSDLSQEFCLESDSVKQLKGCIPNKSVKRLEHLGDKTYQSQQEFELALEANNIQLADTERQIVYDCADIGRKRFEQKFSWIEKYQDDIPVYSKMVELAHLAEKQLSHYGINRNSSKIFLAETKTQILSPRLEKFKDCVNNYLVNESGKIPQNEILWANSNVIESIFGKYKLFVDRSPLKEMSKMVLTIPLCTAEITGQFIKNAMEKVSIKDVEGWANRVLGKSALSKKRTVLENKLGDTKIA